MSSPKTFLAVQQRVLPAYRLPFFEALAEACSAARPGDKPFSTGNRPSEGAAAQGAWQSMESAGHSQEAAWPSPHSVASPILGYTQGKQCSPGGLNVYAGLPTAREAISAADRIPGAGLHLEPNRELLPGFTPLWQVWQPGLLAWLEESDPAVLVAEANPRNRSLPSAIRWMHARGRPVIGWGLGAPPLSGPLAGLRTQMRNSYLSRFDALIAYSRQGAEEYRTALASRLPSGRIFVAPNAAARRPTAPPPERPLLSGASQTVLFVGRLQARKRLDTLLHACAVLPASLRPHLVVVGDGPERPALEQLARQVYPRTEFPGARQGPDLDPYFARAGLFVLPGTGGLAVQQALAAGLPVIVAEADGTQSDLVRPENGWLLPPGYDTPALSQALAAALSDPTRLRRMGAASYRIACDEVNVERMAAAFMHAVFSLSPRDREACLWQRGRGEGERKER